MPFPNTGLTNTNPLTNTPFNITYQDTSGVVPPQGNRRITDDNNVRITDDNDTRITD